MFMNLNMKFKRPYTAVSRSALFDRTFYIRNNPSIVSLGIDPVIHYLKYGGMNGIDPSPLFSSSAYLKNYPDVEIESWNPLAHFELHGAVRSGRYGLQALIAKLSS
jgi:O-antigen biosynthesis protein